MRPTASCLFAVAVLLIGARAVAAPACPHDEAAQLAQDYDTFDEQEAGWRMVARQDDDACKTVAADLIARYRALHRAALRPDQFGELLWHEGQMRAWRGDYPAAARLFRQSRDLLSKDDAIGRRYYDDATIAFIEHDHAALRRAKAALEAMPEPAWSVEAGQRFQQKYGRPPPTWPINHDIVDSLDACFGEPYSVAYAASCIPGKETAQ